MTTKLKYIPLATALAAVLIHLFRAFYLSIEYSKDDLIMATYGGLAATLFVALAVSILSRKKGSKNHNGIILFSDFDGVILGKLDAKKFKEIQYSVDKDITVYALYLVDIFKLITRVINLTISNLPVFAFFILVGIAVGAPQEFNELRSQLDAKSFINLVEVSAVFTLGASFLICLMGFLPIDRHQEKLMEKLRIAVPSLNDHEGLLNITWAEK